LPEDRAGESVVHDRRAGVGAGLGMRGIADDDVVIAVAVHVSRPADGMRGRQAEDVQRRGVGSRVDPGRGGSAGGEVVPAISVHVAHAAHPVAQVLVRIGARDVVELDLGQRGGSGSPEQKQQESEEGRVSRSHRFDLWCGRDFPGAVGRPTVVNGDPLPSSIPWWAEK